MGYGVLPHQGCWGCLEDVSIASPQASVPFVFLGVCTLGPFSDGQEFFCNQLEAEFYLVPIPYPNVVYFISFKCLSSILEDKEGSMVGTSGQSPIQAQPYWLNMGYCSHLFYHCLAITAFVLHKAVIYLCVVSYWINTNKSKCFWNNSVFCANTKQNTLKCWTQAAKEAMPGGACSFLGNAQ